MRLCDAPPLTPLCESASGRDEAGFRTGDLRRAASSLRNKRPGLSGRPPCKGVAIGVARRGARLGGERTLRIPLSRNDDDVNADDDINNAAEDGSGGAHTFNQGNGHDGQRDDCNDVAHHAHQHHDNNIDGSEKYDGSAGDGHDDQYDPNDASYIDDQHDDNQYDNYDDRNDY